MASHDSTPESVRTAPKATVIRVDELSGFCEPSPRPSVAKLKRLARARKQREAYLAVQYARRVNLAAQAARKAVSA